jgi:tryptophan-rich sensory protein
MNLEQFAKTAGVTLIECGPEWGTLIWACIAIYPYLLWVVFANIAYFLWVTFASVLQITIAYLNNK